MNFKLTSFMSEQLNSNKFENDELNHNNEDSDYLNLITRLKEVSKNIFLLEKTILK